MSDYTILLQMMADFPGEERVNHDLLEQAARQVLQMEQAPADSMISIVIATDEYSQELNSKYRQVYAPTDVLSFPAEPLPDEIEEDQGYLGDIIIALPYLARRAHQENHKVQDDLVLMVVHGTLHLLGYDHDTPENQQIMWQIQAAALQALDIHIIVPDYIHD